MNLVIWVLGLPALASFCITMIPRLLQHFGKSCIKAVWACQSISHIGIVNNNTMLINSVLLYTPSMSRYMGDFEHIRTRPDFELI